MGNIDSITERTVGATENIKNRLVEIQNDVHSSNDGDKQFTKKQWEAKLRETILLRTELVEFVSTGITEAKRLVDDANKQLQIVIELSGVVEQQIRRSSPEPLDLSPTVKLIQKISETCKD